MIFLWIHAGDQPSNGRMNYRMTDHRLPGYENDSEGTIEIYYHIPGGIQDVSSHIES